MILEEAPETKTEANESTSEHSLHLLTISAKTDQALRDLSRKYADFLDSDPDVSLADVCFTANVRRSHFDYRLALVVDSAEELSEQLRAFCKGESNASANGQAINGNQKLVFVFSGQGSQWPGMGKQLLEKEPAFRKTLERCDAAIRKIVGWSVIEELTASETESRLDRFDVAQTLLFSVQVSQAALWRSWGAEPEMVVGHSFGEISAACVAGILDLEDAAAVICHRSRLMARLSGAGIMMAVELSAEESLEYLKDYGDRLSVAVCNSPQMSVISGDAAAMESFRNKLSSENVFCRYVKVDVAAHSHYMDELREEFLEAIKDVRPRKGFVPICSTVSPEITDGSNMDAVYWAGNLSQTVRFSQAIELLLERDYSLFLEVSPHPVLISPIREMLDLNKAKGGAVASLRRERDEQESMLMSLGSLYTLGCPVDWSKLYHQGRLLPLPAYAWQKERYWIDASREFSLEQVLMRENIHPLLGRRLHTATRQEETLFESYISLNELPWLKDHQVFENAVFPAAALVEQALAAGKVYFNTDQLELGDVMIQKALVFAENTRKQLQLVLRSSTEKDRREFKIFSLIEKGENKEPEWIEHCSGKIGVMDQANVPAPTDLSALQARPINEIPTDEFYGILSERRLDYGPAFQSVKQVWQGASEAMGELRLPEDLLSGIDDYYLHPALLDGILQIAVSTPPSDLEGAYIPVALENLKFYRRPETSMWCYMSYGRTAVFNSETFRIDKLRLFTRTGDPSADIKGLLLKKANMSAALSEVRPWTKHLYRIDWIHQEKRDQNPLMVSKPGRWMILADKQGIGRKLADLLRERSSICSLVFTGEIYERINEHEFVVNPENPADFEKLLEEFKPDISGKHPDRPSLYSVVHLWSLDSVTPEQMSLEDLEDAAKNGCLGTLFLSQSLLEADFEKPPSLWLVTQKAQAVPDDSSLSISQSPLWGMGRVMTMEHPELLAGMIDLDFGSADEVAADLLKEIAVPDNENHTAFRNSRRYVARLKNFQVPAGEKTIAFDPDATYLITGGLGLEIAGWMVKRGAKHLTLSGRQGVAGNEAARKAVEQMEKEGVEVAIFATDAGDQKAVAEMLKTIETFMPPLKGIIHAAGLLDDAMLRQLSADQFRKVMFPKVQGSWNLHTLTMELNLDFFVCFSSIMSILGYPGQTNYAAANAFMDALVYYRKSLGLPALSINWGPWTEIGLAASLDKISQNRMSRIIESITPEQGLKIMERILLANAPQVGVMSINWAVYLRQSGSGKTPSLFSEQAQAEVRRQKKSNILEKLQKSPENDRLDILNRHLQNEIAKVLGLRSSQLPDIQKRFFEMGMDSMMAVELKNILAMDMETVLPVTLLLEKPNIEELSRYLNQKIWGDKSVAKAGEFMDLSISETHREMEIEDLLDKNYDLSELEGLGEVEIEELFYRELEELNRGLAI